MRLSPWAPCPDRQETMNRCLVLFPGLLVTAVLAACGGSDGDELTIYSGREEPLIGPLIEDIDAKEDGTIAVRYGETPQLASTIIEEGDNSPADIFFSQDAGALGALDSEGLLIELPRDILEKVPARFRASDGTWVGTSGRARVIAYGPDVKRSSLPASVLGLTAPEWKGRRPPSRAPGRASAASAARREGRRPAAARAPARNAAW